MSLINTIENKIKELSGGEFQKLSDAFLAKRFPGYILNALGSQEGTNKPTKGKPDTYLVLPNGKQIFVMYGTHLKEEKKISGDIKSVKEEIEKLGLGTEQIEKIICCHTSSNIGPEKKAKFEKEASPYELELIGINEIAKALCYKLDYQWIAKDMLGVSESTEQVLEIEKFIEIHDDSKTNAPISNDFLGEGIDGYLKDIESDTQILLITGNAGVGKTKLGIEICKELKKKDYVIICVKSNGQEVYQDLKRFIDREQETVVFIDDVNLVSGFKAIFQLLNFNAKLRFIITCRAYSRNQIKSSLKDYNYKELSPKLLNLENKCDLIKQFSADDIHFNIVESIINIGQDNARLIVLAAILSKSKKDKRYETKYEILKDYYEEILDSRELEPEDEYILFIVYFLRKLKYVDIGKNSVYSELLKYFQLENIQLESRIIKLYQKELLDIHNSYICKISDQTLGDYIAIKILEKRKVSFMRLFNFLYNIDSNRFVEILIQYSLINYDKDFLDAIWRSASSYYSEISHDEYKLREDFLLSFSSTIPNEAIRFINEQLDNMEEEKIVIPTSIDEIRDEDNFSIEDNTILILKGLIQGDQFTIPFNLLSRYLQYKPSMVTEAYVMLKNSLNFFLKTWGWKAYLSEVIDMFKNTIGQSINMTNLCIAVYMDFLELKREIKDPIGENIVSSFIYTIPNDAIVKEYRGAMLDHLYKIYRGGNQEQKQCILKYLIDYSGIDIEEIELHTDTIKFDLMMMKTTFFSDVCTLSVAEENVLYRLSKLANQIGSRVFSGYVMSNIQKVHSIISSHRLANISEKNDEKKFESIILENRGRWEQFFSDIKIIIAQDEKVLDTVENVLINLFGELSFKDQCSFIQAMLAMNYKLLYIHPMDFLCRVHPSKRGDVLDIIPCLHKNEWDLARVLMTEKVTRIEYDRLIELLGGCNIPFYYSIIDFLKFIEYCPDILSNEILDPQSEYFWIPMFIKGEDAKRLLNAIGYKKIEELYLSSIVYRTIDESSTLLFEMCTQNMNFGLKVLKKIHSSNGVSLFRFYRIIDMLKEHSQFDELIIEFALYIIREGNLSFWTSKLDNSQIYMDKYLLKLLTFREDLIFELLNRAEDESEFLKIINMGTELVDALSMRRFYCLMKEKRYGITSYSSIHFLKDEHPFHELKILPHDEILTLEFQIECLEDLKQIFSNEINYLDLVRYLNKLIDDIKDKKSIEEERLFIEGNYW